MPLRLFHENQIHYNYGLEQGIYNAVKIDAVKGQAEVIPANEITYVRRQGTSGMHGQLYEIHLSMWFLLQGTTRNGEFYLASNMDGVDAFDDIVYKKMKE